MPPVPTALDHRIVELIKTDRVSIPPFPETAARLMRLTAQDDYRQSDFVELVGSDQVVAALVLRYANSASYRPVVPVTSLAAAVGRLGVKEIIRLALAVGLGARACRSGTLVDLKRFVWRQAVFAAEICAHLAPLRRLDPAELYLSGLLHDFGKVIALGCMDEILAAHQDLPELSRERCLSVIETYAAELGLVMAAKWGLPETIREAVSWRQASNGSEQLSLVVLAHQVAHELERAPYVDRPVLDTLSDLRGEPEKQLLEELLPKLPAIVKILEPVPSRAEPSSRREPSKLPEVVPCQLRATLLSSVDGAPLRVTGVAPDVLELESPVFLPPETLAMVAFPSEGLELWASVARCSSAAAPYRASLRLMALAPPAVRSWLELIARNAAPSSLER